MVPLGVRRPPVCWELWYLRRQIPRYPMMLSNRLVQRQKSKSSSICCTRWQQKIVWLRWRGGRLQAASSGRRWRERLGVYKNVWMTQRPGRRTPDGGHVWMVPWETCMCQASHPGGRLRRPGARIGAWEHLLGPGWHPNKPRREEEGVLGLMGRNPEAFLYLRTYFRERKFV